MLWSHRVVFVLKDIPLPPSSNKLYSSVRGRLIKSIEGRKYASEINIYALKNFKIIDKIKKQIGPNDTLRIDRYFVFHKSRIISKQNEYKKLDATNRIKSADDGLSSLLGIDDKQFISGITEKVTCENEKDEQIIIHISIVKQRTYEDICKIEI